MGKEEQNLDELLKDYKMKYEEAFITCTVSSQGSSLFLEGSLFDMGMAYKWVDLYEIRYPEQKRAFANFFRKADKQFSEDMVKMKCMTYMLEERILRTMSSLMSRPGGIYIKLFAEKNRKGHGPSAYFGRSILGKPRIMYYEIADKRQLKPPYKTFFHEFGHGLDYLMKAGPQFYSDSFTFTQEADCMSLKYSASRGFCTELTRRVYTKTIQEWAELDVENYIIRTGTVLLQAKRSEKDAKRHWNPEITDSDCYQILNFVVYSLFLKPDGADRLKHLADQNYACEMKELYEEIRKEIEGKVLKEYQGIIVLPKDLFGGITNNQLGGGHGRDYWFRGKKRVREISREAFAGYFEYRATIPIVSMQHRILNPDNCMPYTMAALSGMFNALF